MRIAVSKQAIGTPPVSKVTTRPSPVKGLNSFDGITGMGDGYAIVLRNFFAQPYGCHVRKGYVQHVIGSPGGGPAKAAAKMMGPVETLMSHNTSTPRLYAVSYEGAVDGAVLYDVTVPNSDPVEKLADLVNARWQHINFPNAAGVHLIAVNGEENPIWIHPDNTVHQINDTEITGIDPALFIQVYAHQKRLWFVEKDTTFAWYLPPDQLVGVATSFNPGVNWVRGGKLMQIITWTIDDGNGADDHICFISSEGEVSVYQGTDPDGADTWSLQGVYFAGAPVAGHRFATRYGGDILMVTQFGAVLMSTLLKSTKVNPTDADFGEKVQYLVSGAVSTTGQLFGWQPFIFPEANMMMLNVPVDDTTSFQFVMNDITKAWSTFIGYEARCWELHQQMPFFGSLGGVYRAWEQYTDDAIVPDVGKVIPGAEIKAEAQTSFTYFDTLGQNKHFKQVRPSILSSGQFALSLSANMDFQFDNPLAPGFFQLNEIGKWDEDLWEAAVWAGGLTTYKGWLSVTGIGTAASLRLLLRTSAETYWAATDWNYEVGGIM